MKKNRAVNPTPPTRKELLDKYKSYLSDTEILGWLPLIGEWYEVRSRQVINAVGLKDANGFRFSEGDWILITGVEVPPSPGPAKISCLYRNENKEQNIYVFTIFPPRHHLTEKIWEKVLLHRTEENVKGT